VTVVLRVRFPKSIVSAMSAFSGKEQALWWKVRVGGGVRLLV
jgi:hypothetical protein